MNWKTQARTLRRHVSSAAHMLQLGLAGCGVLAIASAPFVATALAG